MMVYLASPYAHPDPATREARFRAACRQAASLLRCGINVYSPIAHTHGIAAEGDLPTDWSFWEKFDRQYIKMCDEVWVLALDGWEESRGVQAEIALARKLGKPVVVLEPEAAIANRRNHGVVMARR